MARRTSAPARIGADLVGLVILLACAFPVYWMVNTSLLPRNEIRSPNPTFVPFGGSFANFRRVLSGGFFDALGSASAVTGRDRRDRAVLRVPRRAGDQPVPVPRPQELHRLAAADPDAPRRGPVHQPVQDARGLGPAEQRAGLTLVYIASALPFTVWMLRGFVAGVPTSSRRRR